MPTPFTGCCWSANGDTTTAITDDELSHFLPDTMKFNLACPASCTRSQHTHSLCIRSTNSVGARNPPHPIALFFNRLDHRGTPLKRFQSRRIHDTQSSRSPDHSKGTTYSLALLSSSDPAAGLTDPTHTAGRPC
jgi:hypothetical protein